MLILFFLENKTKPSTYILAHCQCRYLYVTTGLWLGSSCGQSGASRVLHQITHFLVHVKMFSISTKICITIMWNLHLCTTAIFALIVSWDKSWQPSADMGEQTLPSPTIQSFSTTPGQNPEESPEVNGEGWERPPREADRDVAVLTGWEPESVLEPESSPKAVKLCPCTSGELPACNFAQQWTNACLGRSCPRITYQVTTLCKE